MPLTIGTSHRNLEAPAVSKEYTAGSSGVTPGDIFAIPQLMRDKPLLLLDIDGVFSLFGFPLDAIPPGRWHSVEGVPHLLSATTPEHLQRLDAWFEPVWCSGWEEKASEHLPGLLGVPVLPHLSFARDVGGRDGTARGHWKLAAIDDYAGDRPLAWVDDALDAACTAWAAERGAPTLLLHTDPSVGLTDAGVEELIAWARSGGPGQNDRGPAGAGPRAQR
jgi:hypothetical protein